MKGKCTCGHNKFLGIKEHFGTWAACEQCFRVYILDGRKQMYRETKVTYVPKGDEPVMNLDESVIMSRHKIYTTLDAILDVQ